MKKKTIFTIMFLWFTLIIILPMLFIMSVMFISCNPPSTKKKKDQQLHASGSLKKLEEKLTGKWLRPVPGLEYQIYGFQLNGDHTANSLNMHTLIYDKWSLKSGDTLIMWNHTEGVKNTSKSIDTFVINKLSKTKLIITPAYADPEDREVYIKYK